MNNSRRHNEQVQITSQNRFATKRIGIVSRLGPNSEVDDTKDGMANNTVSQVDANIKAESEAEETNLSILSVLSQHMKLDRSKAQNAVAHRSEADDGLSDMLRSARERVQANPKAAFQRKPATVPKKRSYISRRVGLTPPLDGDGLIRDSSLPP